MESLRDIRKNIKSIQATEKVVSAMKMVAAARVRRAQETMNLARPFAIKMEEMISALQGEVSDAQAEDISSSEVLRLFRGNEKGTALGFVLITSDKGLCGAFNSAVLKTAVRWLKENKDKKIYAFAVGKKGRDFLRRLKGIDIIIEHELTGIFPKAGYVHAEILGKAVLESFFKHNLKSVFIARNDFKSPSVTRFLPFLDENIGHKSKEFTNDFIFEPDKKTLLSALAPRYVKAQLYRILLESQAGELAARVAAMSAAEKNAGEIIDELIFKLNKTRQERITNELMEIVGGAEALK
ncbi:MAG: ATP synthase F1 subunit gamma [Elusimicrobia bacterium]|nr:ATP synthase F1 subunit gamma [Elusimicrobiota bacterium]